MRSLIDDCGAWPGIALEVSRLYSALDAQHSPITQRQFFDVPSSERRRVCGWQGPVWRLAPEVGSPLVVAAGYGRRTLNSDAKSLEDRVRLVESAQWIPRVRGAQDRLHHHGTSTPHCCLDPAAYRAWPAAQ